MKRQYFFGLFVSVLGLSIASHAQAVPTATRAPLTLQVGAGVSIASPDYGGSKIGGGTVYGDFDFYRHIGLEGDYHFINIHTPTDIGETTLMLGPRYSYPRGRLNFYGKFVGGRAQFEYQSGTYNPPSVQVFKAIAFGGGLDIRVRHHINVRAIDFEAQKWINFYPHTLSPYVATFGVAYVR